MSEKRQTGGLTAARSAFSRRRRNYGYRGYGSGFRERAASEGAGVHWAGGFSGFGFPGNDGGLRLPRLELLAERLSRRESPESTPEGVSKGWRR